MPLITLNSSTYPFPVQLPGDDVPVSSGSQIALDVNWGQTTKIPVSLEITGASAGIFAATLRQQIYGRLGPEPPTTVANTAGLNGNLEKPVGGPIVTYPIEVLFTPPAAPVPGYFTGTLAVSGWGGTATMTLVAMTAKITDVTAKVIGVDNIFAPPQNDLPDGSVEWQGSFVTVQIHIASADPNPLKVKITVKSQSDTLLQISPQSQTINVPAPLLLVPIENPKSFPFAVPMMEVPGPFRVGVVTFTGTVDTEAASKQGTVEFAVSTPDFPLLTDGLAPINVKYELKLQP